MRASGEFSILLADTSYFGEISAINPAVSTGDQNIIITVRAIERDSGAVLADVGLNLVITIDGFERSVAVVTDETGSFNYSFTPNPGESGRYQVRAIHPDLLDKPIHGEFVITRVAVSPSNINLSIPRNYEQNFSVQVKTGSGTELHNLQLLYPEENQPNGVYPEGVHLTTGSGIAKVMEKSTSSLPIKLWADNRALDSGKLLLKVTSDEAEAEGWADVVINTTFTTAKPALFFEPLKLETGVVQKDSSTENVKLLNKGLAALEEVRLSLTDLSGSPAPSWVHLNISPDIGDIEIGESRDVPISFSPDANVTEGSYQFQLWVESNNNPTTPIYIFVIVNLDGQGDALFKVSDIYTGTFDQQGDQVLGLAGTKITLQNENTLVSEATRSSDSQGEVEYFDLPAGSYKYRITATNHQEQGTLFNC